VDQSKPMTKASVVILTRNSEDWLIDVLESVSAQTCPRNWLETIIVDQGSTDATTALARFYLARHGIRGGLHASDPARGLAGAMNMGWQTAAGDWIQFIKSPGRLAPDKIQAQLDFVAQLSQSTRAVFSKWQSLRKNGKVWLATGPVNQVAIPAPPYLRLVAPHAPPLGAALLRKQALAEVGGFPEALRFAGDENLLLRIAGMHENTRASRGRFVVAPSATPLYFEREATAMPAVWKAGFAREHLDNLMIARAMLRDHQLGMLTLEVTREIAKLCAESLRDLERYDRRTFKQCSQSLREIDPGLIAPASELLPLLSARASPPAVGPVPANTDGSSACAGHSFQTPSRLDDTLERLRQKRHLGQRARARRGRSRAGWMAGIALGAGAGIALLTGAAVFTDSGGELNESFANLLTPKQSSEGTLNINIAPTIYAEPMSPWPMPILVRGGEELPAGAALQVRGLPVSATLSEGHRTAPDAWIVPLPAVAKLEILISGPTPGRSDLLMRLATAEGNVLAEAHAVLAVADAPTAEPSGDRSASEAAAQSPRPLEAAPGAPDAIPQAPRPALNARAIATSVPVGANERAFATMAPNVREGAGATPAGSRGVDKKPPAPELVVKSVVAQSTMTASNLIDAAATPRTEGIHENAKSPSSAPKSAGAAGKRAPGSEASGLNANSRGLAETMVARGERELSQGNVAAARQFLLRAAEMGSARAALVLGSTYDQHEFLRWRIQGVQPNPSLARKWYLRARELGETEAAAALLRLGSSD
jgi:Glycosyl transferase family 2